MPGKANRPPALQRPAGAGPMAAGLGGVTRAIDRLSDAQLIAAELLVYLGLPDFRIAQRMGLGVETLRRWFRDPVFIAACNELTRAYCAGQLVPLGLYRVRALLADPFTKLRDVVTATRFAAELAGLTAKANGAPEAGFFAPGQTSAGRPLAELSRDELHRLMIAGQQAQQRLQDDKADYSADPLD